MLVFGLEAENVMFEDFLITEIDISPTSVRYFLFFQNDVLVKYFLFQHQAFQHACIIMLPGCLYCAIPSPSKNT